MKRPWWCLRFKDFVLTQLNYLFFPLLKSTGIKVFVDPQYNLSKQYDCTGIILTECLPILQEVCVFIKMFWFRGGLTNDIVTFSLMQEIDHQLRPEAIYLLSHLAKEADHWIVFISL